MFPIQTSGIRIYTDYAIPILYNRSETLPPQAERLYQLLFLENGELICSSAGTTLHYPAPLVLFCGDRNTLTGIKANGGEPHHLHFTPEALNVNYRNLVPGTAPSDFFFLQPFVDPGEKGFACRAFPPEITSKLTILFDRLNRFLNLQEQESWPCLSRSYFLEILILLERSHYLHKEVAELKIPETGTRADSIFHFIHTHYNEELTLEDLARRFATNRTTLNRLVQESGGMSTMAYLNNIRMEIAAGMLRNTHLGVSEIAERIGISDSSYFGRAFRKKTGFSPSDYRDRYPSPYTIAV
jgi:AraC family L-rhamnose operon regulatory protein RhaS